MEKYTRLARIDSHYALSGTQGVMWIIPKMHEATDLLEYEKRSNWPNRAVENYIKYFLKRKNGIDLCITSPLNYKVQILLSEKVATVVRRPKTGRSLDSFPQ